MPKPRGKEWEYVKVLKEGTNNYFVQCNYCSKQFWIGSGSRIRAHLGVDTLSGAAKCEKVPEEVTTQLRNAKSKKSLNSDSQAGCRKHGVGPLSQRSSVTRVRYRKGPLSQGFHSQPE
jgi:hypothetical protein